MIPVPPFSSAVDFPNTARRNLRRNAHGHHAVEADAYAVPDGKTAGAPGVHQNFLAGSAAPHQKGVLHDLQNPRGKGLTAALRQKSSPPNEGIPQSMPGAARGCNSAAPPKRSRPAYRKPFSICRASFEIRKKFLKLRSSTAQGTPPGFPAHAPPSDQSTLQQTGQLSRNSRTGSSGRRSAKWNRS